MLSDQEMWSNQEMLSDEEIQEEVDKVMKCDDGDDLPMNDDEETGENSPGEEGNLNPRYHLILFEVK